MTSVKVDDFTIEKTAKNTYRILKGDSHILTINILDNSKIEIIAFLTDEVFRVLVC